MGVTYYFKNFEIQKGVHNKFYGWSGGARDHMGGGAKSQWCWEHCGVPDRSQPSTSDTITSQLAYCTNSWLLITGGKEYYYQFPKKEKDRKESDCLLGLRFHVALKMYCMVQFLFSSNNILTFYFLFFKFLIIFY